MNGMHDSCHFRQPGLRRFTSGGAADLHCHCLPGLDDGPATMEDAVRLCRSLVIDGISTVVATPHQLGRYEGQNSGREVREAVDALTARLAEQSIPLEVLPGAEVRIDERIPSLVRGGSVLTLADRVYLLLELPEIGFIDPMPLIRVLTAEGVFVIIAHAERYPEVQRGSESVSAWIEAGAALQINAGSLVGRFGLRAEQTAWALIESQSRLLVASGAHDAGNRPPMLSHAAEQIDMRFGFETAFRLCVENPRKVLGRSSRPPMPVSTRKAVPATSRTTPARSLGARPKRA
jgi:protein-tyrosine phosphatase